MTSLELIEKKIPDLNQNELFVLLEVVVHSLKSYSNNSKKDSSLNQNITRFRGAWKQMTIENWDNEISEMRLGWKRAI